MVRIQVDGNSVQKIEIHGQVHEGLFPRDVDVIVAGQRRLICLRAERGIKTDEGERNLRRYLARRGTAA